MKNNGKSNNTILTQKFINEGDKTLSKIELAKILFHNKKSSITINKDEVIINETSLKQLLELTVTEVLSKTTFTKKEALIFSSAVALTKRLLPDKEGQQPQIKTPYDALNYLWDIRCKKKEHFVGLYLNARNHIIAKELISVGTLNASIVHPREVFEPAIRLNAASIIVAHNHPSGDTTPSEADISSTKQLIKAGEILGIDLIDHLIVSKNSFSSLKSTGSF